MKEKELLGKYGSPLYVYNEEVLDTRINNIKEFAEKLKGKTKIFTIKMHYSTKANGNLQILKRIREKGISVDAMSAVELRLAELAGFKKDNILYVCNNVSEEEMANVVDKDILICLDSISQLDILGKIRPNSKVMIRINPGTVGVGHSEKVVTSGKNTKFGISKENFAELFEVAKKYNIEIIGVHQHLGSLFLNNQIDTYIAGVKAGLQIIKENFKNLTTIDLGGGFGVPYKEDEEPLDLNIVAEKLAPILSEFIKEYGKVEFKFEPGRYIPCESGSILGTVNAIKNENGKVWIGTDIGMSVLLRPSMYDAYHKIEVIPVGADDHVRPQKIEYITATIVGNICESGDILGKDRKVLKPELGDVIKIYNSGAYGYSMSSNYTGRTRTAEIMINKNGEEILIRKRETVEDIIKNNIQ